MKLSDESAQSLRDDGELCCSLRICRVYTIRLCVFKSGYEMVLCTQKISEKGVLYERNVPVLFLPFS